MLTRARLRDSVARRTGLPRSVVAQVLDAVEDLVREELVQQGEVAFRGLFRIVPVRRLYRRVKPGQTARLPAGEDDLRYEDIARIILTIRPMRSLRKKLTAVLTAR